MSLNVWHQRLNHISERTIKWNSIFVSTNATPCVYSGCTRAEIKRRNRIKTRQRNYADEELQSHGRDEATVVSFLSLTKQPDFLKHEALANLKKYTMLIEDDASLDSLIMNQKHHLIIWLTSIQSDNKMNLVGNGQFDELSKWGWKCVCLNAIVHNMWLKLATQNNLGRRCFVLHDITRGKI